MATCFSVPDVRPFYICDAFRLRKKTVAMTGDADTTFFPDARRAFDTAPRRDSN